MLTGCVKVMALIKTSSVSLEILLPGHVQLSSVESAVYQSAAVLSPGGASSSASPLEGRVIKGDYRSLPVVFDGFDKEFHCSVALQAANVERNR